jgi:hypothetical protein
VREGSARRRVTDRPDRSPILAAYRPLRLARQAAVGLVAGVERPSFRPAGQYPVKLPIGVAARRPQRPPVSGRGELGIIARRKKMGVDRERDNGA